VLGLAAAGLGWRFGTLLTGRFNAGAGRPA
jgi:hypothetical protein